MPIYTYRCEGCGETFDKRQSFSEDALTTHEACGGELRKVLHPVGIVFKGSGFYNTDYKNGSAGSAKPDDGAKTEGETPAAASSESDAGSKSDTPSTTPATSSTDSASSAAPTKTEPAKTTTAS